MSGMNRHVIGAVAALVLGQAGVRAGPPFTTDDPEPVGYHHWEFYIASTQQFQKSEVDATLPHFEVNYGVLPNVQLHLLAPIDYVHTNEGSSFGYSATELGVKLRFMEETDNLPQIGTFPIIEIPTRIGKNHVESSNIQILIPVWLQKSWGNLTTYGGAGFWHNPGGERKNWLSAGWLIQYAVSNALTLGGEIFYHTADTTDGAPEVLIHFGGFVNIDSNNHLLFCIGPSVVGEHSISGYLGYQLSI
jgi:hypothetical protein